MENWTIFLMTSFPVKMTSPQSSFQWKSRSWVDLSAKKIFELIGPTSCLLNFLQDTLLFRFQPRKKPTFQEKNHQPNLVSTKSTTLNPMVKSDLVTYGGGTERYLFFSVANVSLLKLNVKRAPEMSTIFMPRWL